MEPAALNEDIENLTDARNVQDLARRVQKIMNVMQYYIINSETAILDHEEKWRHKFTRELTSERNSSNQDSTGIPGISQAPTQAQAPSRRQYSNNRARSVPPQNRPITRQPPQNRNLQQQSQAPLPAALAAIMDGSHHTFQSQGQNHDGMFGRDFN